MNNIINQCLHNFTNKYHPTSPTNITNITNRSHHHQPASSTAPITTPHQRTTSPMSPTNTPQSSSAVSRVPGAEEVTPIQCSSAPTTITRLFVGAAFGSGTARRRVAGFSMPWGMGSCAGHCSHLHAPGPTSKVQGVQWQQLHAESSGQPKMEKADGRGQSGRVEGPLH